MNRATLVFSLAVFTVAEGCSAEDPAARQAGDAGGRDTRGSSLYDVRAPDRLDASGGSYDDEASVPPPPEPDAEPDADPTPDVLGPPDTRSDPIADEFRARPDAPPDVPVAPDAFDAGTDPVVTGSCLVTFTVSGVVWSDGGASAGRVVRLVGDVSPLGAWTPASGVTLAEISPGIWSGAVTFRQLQLVEFKFVKIDNGLAPEWESWQPYDSNRSLQIDCGDGGASNGDASDGAIDDAADASSRSDGADGSLGVDAADADTSLDASYDANADDVFDASSDGRVTKVPAVGKRYAGTFGVRPPDATK